MTIAKHYSRPKRGSRHLGFLLLRRIAVKVCLITVPFIYYDVLRTADPLHPAELSAYDTVVTKIETKPYVKPETPEDYIDEVFGKDADDAKKIMMCESGGNPENIGDTHIMCQNNGEMVGDSIGLFQIRTGGCGWNRAKQNGMSADEFRAEMKDPFKNIDYAYEIYQRRGWSAWLNCANKVL